MSELQSEKPYKWKTPDQALALHMLKKKKKALQARISSPFANPKSNSDINKEINLESIAAAAKRKNPFISNSLNKKHKTEQPVCDIEESQDGQFLYKLLHLTNGRTQNNTPSTINPIIKTEQQECELVKAAGEKTIPVDWSLKTKVRFMSLQPFKWNQILKTSEEASGTTGFARCMDIKSTALNLDTSPNAKFHQCCLYWQHPFLPWVKLFPRTNVKAATSSPIRLNSTQIKESLHSAWMDSFKNLFQLIRTRQCAYFYMCANTFTVLFRAAGVCGKTEMHALITPTTRGLRQILRQEEIEFTMPLKKRRLSDQGYNTDSQTTNEDEDEESSDMWLKSMGIKEEDIKQINYTQEKINQKWESEVDNSEQSLVLVEGVEVQALYNFLINCKSNIAITGPFAGIPPTLLSPVAFFGGTMNGLKVRESKVHSDNQNYYSLELTGPILPHTVHNLFAINPSENAITATFANLALTAPFSKIETKTNEDTVKEEKAELLDSSLGCTAFGKASLSDCGLSESILDRFCLKESRSVTYIECLKYSPEDNSYSWT